MKLRYIGFPFAALWAAGLIAFGLFSCMTAEKPDPRKVFAGTTPPSMHHYEVAGRSVLAAEAGNTNGPLVLLIHGTPGGWDDFALVLADKELTTQTLVIAVDRPGWGGSGYGQLETSLARQADAMAGVLMAHPDKLPAVVAGHSLGAPIAARLAMDHPEMVKALVILAGSIDPDQEKSKWYERVARWRIVRWMVPEVLRYADVEIRPLKVQLEEMLPGWGRLRMPVTVVQGDIDALVSPENADFAERMITHAPLTMVRIPNQGHLLHWQRPDAIRAAILPYLR